MGRGRKLVLGIQVLPLVYTDQIALPLLLDVGMLAVGAGTLNNPVSALLVLGHATIPSITLRIFPDPLD